MTPVVHDRVLLALGLIGAVAALYGGFLNSAPNRLAGSVALPLQQAPLIEAAAVMAGLGALTVLAFVAQVKWRCYATLLVAALVLWASLSGAGHFATLLSSASLPAARYSLGAAFWTLVAVALLAMLDAMQRVKLALAQRVGLVAGLCVGFVLMAQAGSFADLSLAKEFSSHRAIFFSELGRHLALVGAAIFCALCMGVPLTALVLRKAKARGLVFASLGILQTIPSIALFGVLIAPLSALSRDLPFLRDLGVGGTGPAPAIIALTLYSLLPLVRSSYTGLAEVAEDVKDAALGMGFDARKLFFAVELPLALPALLSGLRVVAIQAIGLAAVAALIGAGGLGAFVFQGVGQYALDLVLVGAIPIILLALAADFIFQMLIASARRRI
ncbi:ABC transporter permease [Methylocapsa polymorpha]|uniref:ABC transporter permease n=1 Tax=Methylocapsa polymorpha TaxID=3080828 RepID=A0ABZ0HV99_9HYPH|nr:ABC transporter permease [Methylocapsa sp. RX1]